MIFELSLQIFINCLVPVLIMLFILLDMFITITIRKRTLNRQARDRRLQKQFFFLMLSSIIIFLITTLPIAICHIVFPKQVLSMPVEEYGLVMNISAGLTWFWGFNFAVRE